MNILMNTCCCFFFSHDAQEKVGEDGILIRDNTSLGKQILFGMLINTKNEQLVSFK